jgi:hypothetical protein
LIFAARGAAVDDVVDAIARIGVEFARLDLAVPAAILLKDHDQGTRLLAQLNRRFELTVSAGSDRRGWPVGWPVEHPDGSVWMEVEVFGIKVRWPAMKLAKREGGYVWV